MNYIFTGDDVLTISEAIDSALVSLKRKSMDLMVEKQRLVREYKESTPSRLAADKKIIEDYITSFEFTSTYVDVTPFWTKLVFSRGSSTRLYDVHISGWYNLWDKIPDVVRERLHGDYTSQEKYRQGLAFEVHVNVGVDKSRSEKEVRNVVISPELISRSVRIYEYTDRNSYLDDIKGRSREVSEGYNAFVAMQKPLLRAASQGLCVNSLHLSGREVGLVCEYTNTSIGKGE